jgi:RHH-type proline utilization regulon transcriptional repressor/proline dehydrogenase/delta 1-pyrroline-5-carboxylate dehydrogenase
VLRVDGIADISQEIFGPVLHVATFTAEELDQVIDAVNARGYGLTFGMHSRIDDRIEQVTSRLNVGNIYINRNQIGAVVGSQPFGGEGLSGTGPKAGGTEYLTRFLTHKAPQVAGIDAPRVTDDVQRDIANADAPSELSTTDLPGPTGESNRLTHQARLPILCLGPTAAAAEKQAKAVRGLRGIPVLANGIEAGGLTTLTGFSGAIYWGKQARPYAQALAARDGDILALITVMPCKADCQLERHTCVDTTASGGNAALLAEAG